MLVKDEYKGSGDYGVFAFEYTMDKPLIGQERGNETCVVTRVSYPFVIAVRSSSQGFKHIVKNGLLEAEISPGVTVRTKQYTIDQR
jgi:hypothetical protein